MLERRFEQGKPCLPLETKPEIYPDLEPIREAFSLLHNTRQWSNNGEPFSISLTEIKSWIELFDVSDKKEFINAIYVLDREYLAIMREKREEMEKKERNKSGSNSRSNRRSGRR